MRINSLALACAIGAALIPFGTASAMTFQDVPRNADGSSQATDPESRFEGAAVSYRGDSGFNSAEQAFLNFGHEGRAFGAARGAGFAPSDRPSSDARSTPAHRRDETQYDSVLKDGLWVLVPKS